MRAGHWWKQAHPGCTAAHSSVNCGVQRDHDDNQQQQQQQQKAQQYTNNNKNKTKKRNNTATTTTNTATSLLHMLLHRASQLSLTR